MKPLITQPLAVLFDLLQPLDINNCNLVVYISHKIMKLTSNIPPLCLLKMIQNTPIHTMYDWHLFHFEGGLGFNSFYCVYRPHNYDKLVCVHMAIINNQLLNYHSCLDKDDHVGANFAEFPTISE